MFAYQLKLIAKTRAVLQASEGFIPPRLYRALLESLDFPVCDCKACSRTLEKRARVVEYHVRLYADAARDVSSFLGSINPRAEKCTGVASDLDGVIPDRVTLSLAPYLYKLVKGEVENES